MAGAGVPDWMQTDYKNLFGSMMDYLKGMKDNPDKFKNPYSKPVGPSTGMMGAQNLMMNRQNQGTPDYLLRKQALGQKYTGFGGKNVQKNFDAIKASQKNPMKAADGTSFWDPKNPWMKNSIFNPDRDPFNPGGDEKDPTVVKMNPAVERPHERPRGPFRRKDPRLGPVDRDLPPQPIEDDGKD